jgi:hypothetical protein
MVNFKPTEDQELVRETMAGFAREGRKPESLAEVVAEESGEVLEFDEQGVSWRRQDAVSNGQREHLRRVGVHAVGSGYFVEHGEARKPPALL